jgi:hypothetical protein
MSVYFWYSSDTGIWNGNILKYVTLFIKYTVSEMGAILSFSPRQKQLWL